ncbi:MAG TPA: hypothetical protein VM618_12250 [Acidimicrobiia bacterium]|nr:hypothetical protein [Acidimicrobiia bacterium]
MVLRDLHVGWAWLMIIGNGFVGLWVLAAARLPSLRTRAMWWSVIAAQVTIFVQVGLGVAAMQVEGYEPAQFHMFYGFVAIIAVAILYSYRQQMAHRLHLLYGLGSLFLMGLGIRALLVGSGG